MTKKSARNWFITKTISWRVRTTAQKHADL